MDIQAALIASLVEFYSVEQIREFWRLAAYALMTRATEVVTITGTTFGSQSSTGLALGTPEEKANFIAACRAAIDRIQGTTTVDPSTLGTGVDFSRHIVQA